MASITDDTRFSKSEEVFTWACLSLHRFICVTFGRSYGGEPLQSALVILDSLNSISDMLIRMEGLMPWTVIATFLNTLQRRTAAGVRYERKEFPFQTRSQRITSCEGFFGLLVTFPQISLKNNGECPNSSVTMPIELNVVCGQAIK